MGKGLSLETVPGVSPLMPVCAIVSEIRENPEEAASCFMGVLTDRKLRNY